MSVEKNLCVICKKKIGTLTIKDGNPEFIGKPICVPCEDQREMLKSEDI